ncbi:MAG: polymerase subunit sigma [Caulobacter sp.]|nr:polymerase subunit sigma [Caulobacter sp.]
MTMSYAASPTIHGRIAPRGGEAAAVPGSRRRTGGRGMTTDLDRERLKTVLGQVAAGDRNAMADLYRATSAKLYGVCLRIVRDDAEAEEVLQEVYLTVWKRAASYDPAKASPITWLAAVARNRAIDRLRASGARVVRSSGPIDGALDLADPAPDAESQLGHSEDSRRLKGCLDRLEPDHAGLIRRAFFGGLSYSDLAQAAGRPLGTVKTWIRKGLMNLKVCLES